LLQCFGTALARWRHGDGEVVQCLPVAGAVGVAEQDGVVAAGAMEQNVTEPIVQIIPVRDVTALHRPFDTM